MCPSFGILEHIQICPGRPCALRFLFLFLSRQTSAYVIRCTWRDPLACLPLTVLLLRPKKVYTLNELLSIHRGVRVVNL